MESNTEKEPLTRRRTDVPVKSWWLSFLRRDVSLRFIATTLAIYLCLLTFYFFIIKPPSTFPSRQIITIEEGMSLKDAAEYLKQSNLIRSELWLRNFVIIYSGEKSVLAGDYYFEEPVSLLTVASTITDPEYQIQPVRMTFPEGLNSREMAAILDLNLTDFDSEHFLSLVKDKEGYLFPDTYFFLPTVSEEVVVATMEDNFRSKIENLEPLIEETGKEISEIIKMASILELEGNNRESREIISGILWKRLRLGMPLQVDASFAYIFNKGTSEITAADLKSDSPYNSYKFKGLPPTPISNPGLESIRASLMPVPTSYLYYLSDKDGNMYYAKDFEEHKKNRSLYLD